MSGKRILFLSILPPDDKRSWSGICYQVYSNIAKHHTVHWHGPLYFSKLDGRLVWLFNFWNRLRKRKFTTQNIIVSKAFAHSLTKKIRQQHFDIIVAGAGEAELLAFFNTQLPIIYIADSTFKNMLDYYPWHTGLHKSALSQGNIVEQNAISSAAHIIYSSSWAAQSAINNYSALPSKISIVPFGANMSVVPNRMEVLEKTISQRLDILFIGVHWVRKGGYLVHETYLALKKMGVSCTLTIIGCTPPVEPDADMRIIPFLDKNNQSDYEILYDVMINSYVLMVPSRADCTPVVFSEGAAFGLPVITSDTGGITEIVKDGITGYTLPMSSGAAEYSAVLKNLWEHPQLYKNMRVAARNEYERRLNWNHWTNEFNRIVNNIDEGII